MNPPAPVTRLRTLVLNLFSSYNSQRKRTAEFSKTVEWLGTKLIDSRTLCNTRRHPLCRKLNSGCACEPCRITIPLHRYASCPESPVPSFDLGDGSSRFWFSPGVLGTKQQALRRIRAVSQTLRARKTLQKNRRRPPFSLQPPRTKPVELKRIPRHSSSVLGMNWTSLCTGRLIFPVTPG